METSTRLSGFVGLFGVLALASCATATAPTAASDEDDHLGVSASAIVHMVCTGVCKNGSQNQFYEDGDSDHEAYFKAIQHANIFCASNGGLDRVEPCGSQEVP
jgi:hypothetical protein